jgi:hypothetical protein
MAKKSAKKSKPKKRTAKAVTAAAKKTRASAARAKKAASPKKAARKVAKKAVARAKAPTPKKAKRAAPKRAAPVKPAVKKTSAKTSAARPTAKKPAARKPAASPFRRRDGAGHLDPKYATDLMAQSGIHEDEGGRGFLKHTTRSKDDLAEELGEEFVRGATSGEADGEDSLNQVVDEETGGPFVGSTGGTEFAEGTDASNPESAEREPFPKT